MTNQTIRTKPAPLCTCCQSEGTYLYRNLKDRLFGVAGEWHFKKCNNKQCGLIWQDPMPIEEDLGLLYKTYYTHQDAHQNIKRGKLKRLLRNLYLYIRQGYLANKYGYFQEELSFIKKMLGYVLYLFPGRRAWVDSDVFYLPHNPNAKLLEIGFGGGDALKTMKELGWKVKGLDFDPNAVLNAKNKGLDVNLGSLMEQNYADNTFDAVVMSHVIEHVPDPKALIKEIYRVLKKGGVLVSITPNTDGLGHSFYKENWRGLEPPRHLNIFNKNSTLNLLKVCNFENVSLVTTIRASKIMMIASHQLKKQNQFDMSSSISLDKKLFGFLMQNLQNLLLILNRNLGEEVLLKAIK